MTIDNSQSEWALPAVIAIEMRHINYQAHRLRNFESILTRYNEAIEFIVMTEGPIPIRALGPALFVGNEQVIESELLSEDTYRFLFFEIDRLEPGAPISWGWINDSQEQRRETGYRFDL